MNHEAPITASRIHKFRSVIVLCVMGEQNHDKMKLTHEEEIRLVKNDKKDVVEKRRGKRA